MHAQAHLLGLGDLAAGVRDLVLGLLVLEVEDAAGYVNRGNSIMRGEWWRTYRLGSMLLPSELLRSLRNATGPMLARWSELGLVMILSQMTAVLVASVALVCSSPHSAVTYTKTCFVFHVKSDDRSASRWKRTTAYSSFFLL